MMLQMKMAEAMENATRQTGCARPYDINDGFCVEWAESVMDGLRDSSNRVEMWETPFGFADANHTFIRIDGKFFDAEALHGVEDHMDLPIFHRLALAGAGRQPVWCVAANADVSGDSMRDMTEQMVAQYNEENGIE